MPVLYGLVEDLWKPWWNGRHVERGLAFEEVGYL